MNFGEFKFGIDSVESKSGEHQEESRETHDIASNDDSQARIREIEPEPSFTAPAGNVNVPETVLARSRVTMYGSVTTGATYAWTQVEGPAVTLSNANSLAPSFTAPGVATKLVFELAVSDSSGLSITTLSTINVITDDVTIHSVRWTGAQDSGKSKTKAKTKANGRLNVVASSSAISDDSQPPVGMTMTASFWSKDIPAGKFGSASQPVEVPMVLVKNVPGKAPLCANALPCFSVDLSDGIINPKNQQAAPLFVPPTAVLVKSFLGGEKAAKGKEIHIQ